MEYTSENIDQVAELILTEWADDEDLLDISKFLKERLDT